jgi:hypothetical protein
MNTNHEHGLADGSSASLPATHKATHPSKWRTAVVLLAILLVALSVIATVNHIGIRIAGDVLAWRQWIHDHALHFFLWRLFLYGATASGWIWMRRRKLQRFPSKEMRQQMQRTEIGVILFLALFEIQKWLLRA